MTPDAALTGPFREMANEPLRLWQAAVFRPLQRGVRYGLRDGRTLRTLPCTTNSILLTQQQQAQTSPKRTPAGTSNPDIQWFEHLPFKWEAARWNLREGNSLLSTERLASSEAESGHRHGQAAHMVLHRHVLACASTVTSASRPLIRASQSAQWRTGRARAHR